METLPLLMPSPARVGNDANPVEFWLKYGCALDELVILAGWCSRKFSIYGKKGASLACCFAKERKGFKFCFWFPKADAEDALGIKWGDLEAPLRIVPAGLAAFSPSFLPQMDFALPALLKSLPLYSPAWNSLVSAAIRTNRFAEIESLTPKILVSRLKGIGITAQPACSAFDKVEISDGKLLATIKVPESVRAELFLDKRKLGELQPSGNETSEFSQPFPPGREASVLWLRDADSEKPLDFRIMSPYRPSGAYQTQIDRLENEIRGWSIDKNNPARIYPLALLIDDCRYAETRNDIARPDLAAAGIARGTGGFSFINPVFSLPRGPHKLEFELPDDTRVGSCVIESEKDYIRPIWDLESLQRRVSIIIPIYNAFADLKTCLANLRQYTRQPYRLILVDDCSPDPRIKKFLASYQTKPGASVFVNKTNLGFSGSINRGLLEAGDDDVVILNSDARVTPRWLEGLLIAAQSDPSIATVTPMSDRAGAFSAPCIGNDNYLPDEIPEDEFARAFRRESLGLYPSVPTGNGFCMFMKRKCLEKAGLFDQEAFPRGYGEENDFCMRALRLGWRHIIDDCTYIFHDKAKSFKGSMNELALAGRKVIDERYPEYSSAIRVFSQDGQITLARFRANMAMKNWRDDNRMRVLHLLPNADLAGMSLNLEGGERHYFLTFDKKGLELWRKEQEPALVSRYAFSSPSSYASQMELEAFCAGYVYALDIDRLVSHGHIDGMDLERMAHAFHREYEARAD